MTTSGSAQGYLILKCPERGGGKKGTRNLKARAETWALLSDSFTVSLHTLFIYVEVLALK